jgi:hypothetical protein
MREAKQTQLDPLFVIFEQHLYNFQDSELDRKTFIEHVLKDYLTFLRKRSIIIPKSLESSILEELADQIQLMLVKKIYGFLTIQDYQNQQPTVTRRRARSRYSKVMKKAK